MKTLTFALAALALGSSLSVAQAEPITPASSVVPVAQATRVAAPIVEGRQAVRIEATAPLTDAERFVIEQNAPNDH